MSRRSRAVSREPSLCFETLSGPPPRKASAFLSSSSRTRSSVRDWAASGYVLISNFSLGKIKNEVTRRAARHASFDHASEAFRLRQNGAELLYRFTKV